MSRALKNNQGKSRLVFIFIVFSILVFAPALFIADSLEEKAASNFDRLLAKGYIELQNELLQFKLDLIPRNHIEKMLRKMEQIAGIFPDGNARPIAVNGEDPGVFSEKTINRLLEILSGEWQVQPLYISTIDADVYNIYSWYQKDFLSFSTEEKADLDLNMAMAISDLRGIDPLTSRSDVVERYEKRKMQARGKNKNNADGIYCALRKAFSEMIYLPTFHGTTYQVLTNRFNCKRLFLHVNCLKDGEKVFGGYFIIFANKDLPPESILKRSRRSSRSKIKRTYSDCSSQNKHVVSLESLLPSEFLGYCTLFASKHKLPEKLFVSRDFSLEYQHYSGLKNLLSATKKLFFLIIFIAFFRIYLFGFQLKIRLRKKILFTVCLIVLLPYLLLGHFAGILISDLENLRIDEVQSELHRYLYELENYYKDQKLQHYFRLFQSKISFVDKINVLKEIASEIKAYDFVEPDGYCDFTCYRNDGFARKYRSVGDDESRPDGFFQQLGAKYLESLGFLDKSSSVARKDLEMSGLTDGFLAEMRQGYLEHNTLNFEGIETRDMRKIDDFSRMVFFLIPQSKIADSPIRALVFGAIMNLNYTIFQPDKFTRKVFEKESLFSRAELMMGMRGSDGLVGRWWPRESNSLFELKRLLDFAAKTHSSGGLLVNESGRVNLSGWKFVKSEGEIFSGKLISNPDKRVELAAFVFPLMLIIFTLISIFLFADILGAFFISPVRVFAEGAEKIRDGEYSVRIEIENTDELGTLAESFNIMAEGLQQRDRMRRFVSEDLFLKIQNETAKAEESLLASELTMLASDIRGFTTLSEKFDAHEVVSLLNDYFTEMEKAITSNNGLITRFVGDAVMAVFYSGENSSGAHNAINAAIVMRKALAELNCKRELAGLFTIDNGIGIATGKAVAGIAGSQKGRKVFSVIGEVPREAEKLEALSKFSRNLKVLVCGNTFSRCADSFSFSKLSVTSQKEKLIELVGVKNVV